MIKTPHEITRTSPMGVTVCTRTFDTIDQAQAHLSALRSARDLDVSRHLRRIDAENLARKAVA